MIIGTRWASALRCAGCLLFVNLTACTSIGPQRLDQDRLDYVRVISDAGKRQTLFNIVRLRFGEPPTFLALDQVVSGYTLQTTGEASVDFYRSATENNFLGVRGAVDFTDRPTFTLTPITGERFVESYLRPLPPVDLLSLMQGGVPVDSLLRLFAQSIGSVRNANPLDLTGRSSSSDFLELVADLRRLQAGGALRLRFEDRPGGPRRVFLLIDPSDAPDLAGTAHRARQLLAVDPSARELEVVYGTRRVRPSRLEIPILTRSMLAALGSVASEIELPDEDVRNGRAAPQRTNLAKAPPLITIHSGPAAPPSNYSAVLVDGRWYWLEDTDYRSKLAFTLLEIMKSVAESTRGVAVPMLTIPAG